MTDVERHDSLEITSQASEGKNFFLTLDCDCSVSYRVLLKTFLCFLFYCTGTFCSAHLSVECSEFLILPRVPGSIHP